MAQDVEQMIEQGKIARTQFLRANSRPVLQVAGTVVVLCAVAILLRLGKPTHQHALEATAQMERLAVKLSRAKTIAPSTAQQVTQLIREARYSCIDTACDTALEMRNRVARLQLQALLSKATDDAGKTVSDRNTAAPEVELVTKATPRR